MSEAITEEVNKKWYEADESNNWTTCVRVVILTDDDATIYVNLLKPLDPDF